ncbi:MAG TPA: ABC transporter ATP-binding protein [Flavobacteriaceae bacterium]|nr:ABC transporter ATP-binding protein [Flavobacteriaceae bacterium]
MKSNENQFLLKTEQLEIGYRHKKKKIVVASEIELSLRTGELTAVIGVNGSGKSTLLKTLTGDLPTLNGAVSLQAVPLEKYSNKQLSETISVVLTNQLFSKNLSVFELVALGRQPYTNWLGTLSENDRQAVNIALEQVEIEDLKQKKCGELSDGQLQKTMIARALAQDTSLIFMDEPTTHLDLYHKIHVLQLLKKLTQQTQKTIVFASHEINLALQLCNKIILVNNQKAIQGTPNELIESGIFEVLFPSESIQFHPETKSFQVKK